MKFKILFVDDELNVLNGIKRMLYSMKSEWEIFYAQNGMQALDILKKNKIDIIISDIKMPGMDGAQLLSEVKNKYPQIIRITLSGYANETYALKNTRNVHQSLIKPTNAKDIKNTIERALNLRKLLNNDEIQKTINAVGQLPSLPEIYIKLEKEINAPNFSIERIANIVSTDPLITAKILQLTNSAFFGLPIKTTNIKQALNYIGITTFQTLVLTIKLFDSISKNNPNIKLYKNIFNHSKKVAFIAKKLSCKKNITKQKSEEIFISGLLHDIGKLIILKDIGTKKINCIAELNEYELKKLKTSHAEIGAYLLGIWGFSDNIVEAVAFHHSKDLYSLNVNDIATFVFTANNISNKSKILPDDINEDNVEDLINHYGKNYNKDSENDT